MTDPTDRPTIQPTDRPTDGRTDTAGHREVSIPIRKNEKKKQSMEKN